jgi:hypothetical protein
MSLAVYKSPGVIETEVLMMRQENSRKSFLVLEGVDDIRFWTSRVADEECELIDGNGKPNVEGALVRLDGRSFAGALGIVDDDCDALECRSLPSPNLIATDGHDLECVLLRSSALDRALAEFGSKTKIKKFVGISEHEVRDVLLDIGMEFGLLRWLSRRDGWPYPFETNGPARFVDEATWTLDTNRLYDAVVGAGPYGSALLRCSQYPVTYRYC